MKIAFVTVVNPLTITSWSGTMYFLIQSLEANGHQVTVINQFAYRPSYWIRFLNKFYKKVKKKSFSINRTDHFNRSIGKELHKFDLEAYDFILCPSTIPVAYIKTKTPVVIYTDAVFSSMINFYASFSNLSERTIKDGNQTERKSLQNADLVLFSSHWAKNAAIQDYQISESKIKIVPFGANFVSTAPQNVRQAIENRSNNGIRFLWVGVDWDRKGGQFAFETINKLHHQGIQVHFDIVGVTPNLPENSFTTCHGFLRKSDAIETEKLRELFLTSHFLFLPSFADCSPIVFCEAASFGLPVLAFDVGGIASTVLNNKTGLLFPLNSSIDTFANAAYNLFLKRNDYLLMANEARNRYENVLNWQTVADTIVAQVKQLQNNL